MGETRSCPFDGCDWSYEYRRDSYTAELDADFKAEHHYERAHAGRVRIQVTLETEQRLGPRDPKQVRKQAIERFEDTTSYDVAHARTEVLEAADDHDRINRDEQQGVEQ